LQNVLSKITATIAAAVLHHVTCYE